MLMYIKFSFMLINYMSHSLWEILVTFLVGFRAGLGPGLWTWACQCWFLVLAVVWKHKLLLPDQCSGHTAHRGCWPFSPSPCCCWSRYFWLLVNIKIWLWGLPCKTDFTWVSCSKVVSRATDLHLWWLELCGTGWAAAAARSSFHRQHGGEVIIQNPTGLESCKRETADTGTGGAETWTFLLTWLAWTGNLVSVPKSPIGSTPISSKTQ